MNVGRMEQQRQLLWSHGWVIASVFGDGKIKQADIDSFIRYGAASSGGAEPRRPGVDDKVAEILRTGVVRFN